MRPRKQQMPEAVTTSRMAGWWWRDQVHRRQGALGRGGSCGHPRDRPVLSVSCWCLPLADNSESPGTEGPRWGCPVDAPTTWQRRAEDVGAGDAGAEHQPVAPSSGPDPAHSPHPDPAHSSSGPPTRLVLTPPTRLILVPPLLFLPRPPRGCWLSLG